MRRLLTLGVGCAIAVSSATGVEAARGCQVSKLSPIKGRTSFNVGTSRLAVSLPENATFVVGRGRALLEQDGSIRFKLGWLSPSGGPRGFPNGGPLVTGRRLDRSAAPLRVKMGVKSFALGSGEFYPSSLNFPTAGCWRLSARNADARLSVIVRVVEE